MHPWIRVSQMQTVGKMEQTRWFLSETVWICKMIFFAFPDLEAHAVVPTIISNM